VEQEIERFDPGKGPYGKPRNKPTSGIPRGDPVSTFSHRRALNRRAGAVVPPRGKSSPWLSFLLSRHARPMGRLKCGLLLLLLHGCGACGGPSALTGNVAPAGRRGLSPNRWRCRLASHRMCHLRGHSGLPVAVHRGGPCGVAHMVRPCSRVPWSASWALHTGPEKSCYNIPLGGRQLR